MRRALFAFLMVLLVFRGLTGNAMAYEMAPQLAPTQPLVHQGTSHSDHPAAYEDSHHSSPSAPAGAHCAGATDTDLTHGHHAVNCTACDVCHSPMLAVRAPLAANAPAATEPLPTGTVPFDSAPTALAIKPPIA